MQASDPENLGQALSKLEPKNKTPASARVLNTWIAQAQDRLESDGPRLGWLVAATVVSAALQRAVDKQGDELFLLKGGTMLQYRLPGMSRTTKDIDGLVRGDLDHFLDRADEVLREPWGPLTFERSRPEPIDVPGRLSKPRRFDVIVSLRGVTWRRVPVEISPDEGSAGALPEVISSPSLAGFGLPTPDRLTSLSMAYQIAQKIHACTDPHEPPKHINNRVRDVVDLILLRDLAARSDSPSIAGIRSAVEDVFAARASMAEAAGLPTRRWPATATAYRHWRASFTTAAQSAGVALSLEDAVAQVNTWLEQINRS